MNQKKKNRTRTMPHPGYPPISLLICLLLLMPTAAHALEYEADVFVTEQLTLENNYLDSLSGTFNRRDPFHIIAISPRLEISQGNRLHLHLIADLAWTHCWENTDADDLDAELINAAVTVRTRKLTTAIGLQSFQLGGGYIMAGDEPGITIQYRPASPLTIGLSAAQIIHTSPIVSATLDYQLGFLEKIGLFGTWFQDRDDSIADMLNYQDAFLFDRWLYRQNRVLWLLHQNNRLHFTDSRGDLFWYGLRGGVFLGDSFLSGILIFETGKGEAAIEYPSRNWKFTVSAYLIDLDLHYPVTDLFSITPFVFVSGGTRSDGSHVNTFIAPMPRNNRTAVFFNPQFSNQIEEDFLSKGGVHWAGVIAPGIKLQYDPSEGWESGITVEAFFPEDPPADQITWYGWEADVSLAYTWRQRHSVFCEFGWFQHGDFYTRRGITPDPASLFRLGVQSFF